MASARVVREALLDAVRRYGRIGHEREDLAHELIVAALRRAVPLESERLLAQARGAARRHAAFAARTAARRRAREARYAGEVIAEEWTADEPEGAAGAPWSVLSPTLRTTLHLLCLGLDKAELRAVLGVSDAALRKRFEALRAHAPLARPARSRPPRTSAQAHLRRTQVALLPTFAPAVRVGTTARRVFSLGDPDGHGLIFAAALTPGTVAATTRGRPSPAARAVGPT